MGVDDPEHDPLAERASVGPEARSGRHAEHADEDGVPAVETGPAAGPPLGPVAVPDRIASLDVLRGVAVLGILAMNIYSFGLPNAAYGNPLVYGGFSGLDRVTWIVTHLVFELKFMAIFSALFGAGVILMHERAEARNRPLRGVYYRRIFWLLVFGTLHGYFLWVGDILFTYGLAGLVLYLFRRRSPRTLLIVASVILLIPLLAAQGGSYYVERVRTEGRDYGALREAGETLTDEQERSLETWEGMREFLDPTDEDIQEEIEANRGGYLDVLRFRAPAFFMSQTMSNVFFVWWRAWGVMLVGMALMKLGVLSARRSRAFYRRSVLWGYGLGFPLVAVGAWDLIRNDFDPVHMLRYAIFFNYLGSLLVALGHVGVVMLLCQSGALRDLQHRFGAVGRMAFSNYLLDSVICTTIFYGYGLGLFARLERFELMGIVVAVWVLQLWLSPWWLRRFRFGPAEWLWRALTYGRRSPLRVASAQVVENVSARA